MSTTRYSNAGAPGAGTTLDNMASRAKHWTNFHGNFGGSPSIRGSLNQSGLTDGGVGLWRPLFTAPMAAVTYAAVCNFTRMSSWVSSGAHVSSPRNATDYVIAAIENGVAIDPNDVDTVAFGTLA